MKQARVIIVRMDRMGDVMMALPTVEFVRLTMPEAEIDFLIQEIYVDVVAPYLKSRHVNVIGYKEGENPFSNRNYSGALLLYAGSSLLFKSLMAHIPIRIGIYSKLSSFLILSSGLRQRRSSSDKNEALYNIDLARFFVLKMTREKREAPLSPICLLGDEESASEARLCLKDIGINAKSPFILFHPGMGGSALNLSPQLYLKLIVKYENESGLPVVLSIGPVLRDQELAAEVLGVRPDLKVIRHVSLSVLREIFRLADLVVAPSTGPLHLAHFVGTKTVGLYPPVLSQRKDRWAPWGGAGESKIFAPSHPCPGTRNCIGAECQYHFCMDKFDWLSLPLVKDGV